MGGLKAAAALQVVAILIASEVGVLLALREPDIKGTTAGGGSTDPTAMGENAAAASNLIRRYVRMGTVMLLGSLAQPRSVRFDFERCVLVPKAVHVHQVANVDGGGGAVDALEGTVSGGAGGGGGGEVDALVWWDVFLGDPFFDRTVCDAVQLFASPDCSGAAVAKYQNTVYHTRDMSAFMMGASVKSIRCVVDDICSRVKCPQHSTLPSLLALSCATSVLRAPADTSQPWREEPPQMP
ncbi:unnamed protein product [Closterium sp. Yama58-4]|nr:unnamed protein product [Closterium sp. Yama58-4]